MGVELGIVFAFAAMLAWGFGDFLIQKSTRKFGDWETLFLISFFGAIVLFPFVYKDLPILFSFQDNSLLILVSASLVILFAALLDFEALKRGKLSVVEPIYALEIPIAAFLAFFILKEVISSYQLLLIILLMFGLILISLKSYHFSRKIWLEKGVILVFLGTIFMGAANFLVGVGARITDALMINWFMSIFMAIITFSYILSKKRATKMGRDLLSEKKLLFSMCLLDNIAWVAFAFAMTLAPIAIAVALSESYIIIAVLLGMFVNKENLRLHQKVGLVISIIAAITLAYFSG